MGRLVAVLVASCFSVPVGADVVAEDQPPDGTRNHQAALEMAAEIDRFIDKDLQTRQLKAVAPCDDAAFLRRISLDLTGVIPTVAQVREFLQDESPDKRSRWIERMLQSPRHPTHLAATWQRLLLPQRLAPGQQREGLALRNWLRKQFARNVRYDRLVASFLSATGEEGAGPAVFYQSLQVQPEKLAAATSRIFLGVQIHCAECHDHPFDHWTQEDFWGYAAFFAQLRTSAEGPNVMQANLRLIDQNQGDVRIPGTDEIVRPKYPTASSPVTIQRGTRRRQLAIWMASRDNPFLSVAAVNRVWFQLFGRGLVNPVDDLGKHNPPSHPELLDALTNFFVDQQFDLRQLYRAITNSQAYQRASRSSQFSQQAMSTARYQRAALRRLTVDQLYDSLQRSFAVPRTADSLPLDERRWEFVAAMRSRSNDPTVYDWGVQQALRMMNGRLTTDMTASRDAGLLASLDAPFWDDPQRLEILFLATVSRKPTKEEIERILPLDERNAHWGQVLWALVNSAEYQFIR